MSLHPAISAMIKSYQVIKSSKDEHNMLKEIIQKICLLGLYREDFFANASFYGGTALRIIYGLERFSEDLDFCLDHPDPAFRWIHYKKSVENELKLYGFDSEFEPKKDDSESTIGSAFVKQSTLKGLIVIESASKASKHELIKVRLELDKSNPSGSTTEFKMITQPEPFQIKTLDQASLFAGKMHAIIARQYSNRVKGRDYFDLLFYVSRRTKLNLKYLANKLKDSGHLESAATFTEQTMRELYLDKIMAVNFKQAVSDVSPYLGPTQIESLRNWNASFFAGLSDHIQVE